jgi:hypothetical protein
LIITLKQLQQFRIATFGESQHGVID